MNINNNIVHTLSQQRNGFPNQVIELNHLRDQLSWKNPSLIPGWNNSCPDFIYVPTKLKITKKPTELQITRV
jgi:hypothetical protein